MSIAAKFLTIIGAFPTRIFLTWSQLQYTSGSSDLVVITTNEICATSSLLFIPAVTPLCLFLGGPREGHRYWVWQRTRCAFTCCDCSIATRSCLSLCSSLFCHRLWSKTLSVMEEAQQERQWEGRPASLTSPQPLWATGPCQCRPLQTQPSHRRGVSHFSLSVCTGLKHIRVIRLIKPLFLQKPLVMSTLKPE